MDILIRRGQPLSRVALPLSPVSEYLLLVLHLADGLPALGELLPQRGHLLPQRL